MALPLPTGASLTPPALPKGASLTAPEQGNMYTQGAEDIVYDPMGIPLTTSSYGSGPTGYTETARKGLTTAAAVPVNIATGVAKNVGGVAQTLGKYFGVGDRSADNMVNAINQIETGTQQASGDTGGTIGAIGSAVGQAAPWLATGGGAIPSFAKAVERGFVTGTASALATPEQVGLTPEQFADAKKKEIAIQGGIGAALPFAGKLVGAGYNTIKGAIEPFYEGGRNKIIGRALREFAGNDADTAITNLRNAPELVKGSMPTVGQAAGVPSLAALERTAMATSPEAVNALAGRKAAQSAAQTNALESIATPSRVAKYEDLRAQMGEELYEPALSKAMDFYKLSPQMQKQVGFLAETPAIKKAMEQAKENSLNRGVDIGVANGSLRGLHETKMALDEQIGAVKAKLERDGLGSTSAELDGLNKAKQRLLGFIEEVSPEYKVARETYARLSKPVEQLGTIKDLAFKSVTEKNKIKEGQFLNNLRKLKEEGSLSDGQYKRLEAIAEDMKRVSEADTSGRGVGSDTVQKLAYSNMLNLQGIPNALRNWGPASFLGNVAGRVGDMAYGGMNKQLKGQLAETLLSPQEAARLMEQTAPKASVAGPKTEKAKQLAKMLMLQTTGQALQGE